MLAALFLYLLIVYVLVFKRADYQIPASTDNTATAPSKFTYHQLLALLTPLIETVQICGIIVYFFWNSVPLVTLTPSGNNLTDLIQNVPESGTWAATMFGWGAYSGGQSGFQW
jgi:hypothetical protein